MCSSENVAVVLLDMHGGSKGVFTAFLEGLQCQSETICGSMTGLRFSMDSLKATSSLASHLQWKIEGFNSIGGDTRLLSPTFGTNV
jgi:hypothetical protein